MTRERESASIEGDQAPIAQLDRNHAKGNQNDSRASYRHSRYRSVASDLQTGIGAESGRGEDVQNARRGERRTLMSGFPDLEIYLDDWSQGVAIREALAATVCAIAGAARELTVVVSQGPLARSLPAAAGRNAGGEAQKELDVRARNVLQAALRNAPVAAFGSGERRNAKFLDRLSPVGVAIDPLEGSSNIDANVPIGTIFSILPMPPDGPGEPDEALLQAGSRQLAAGFVVYGPRTELVFSVGKGTQVCTLDRVSGRFLVTRTQIRIPAGRCEYAIDASNYPHWDEPIRAYIDDCMVGEEGPRGERFNMRGIASLVAETYRILGRGGIFLYPRDARPGHGQGRFRLVYEANPVAFVVEQAGGGATDGQDRILDLVPDDLDARVPLVFGSRDKVDRITRSHGDTRAAGERVPRFDQ